MAVVASISQQIWDMKYRLKGPANGPIAGEPIDKTIEDTWRRVATAAAAPEKEPQLWADRFYAAMSDFRFLPAGRVIAAEYLEDDRARRLRGLGGHAGTRFGDGGLGAGGCVVGGGVAAGSWISLASSGAISGTGRCLSLTWPSSL